jgi:Skp family chaperone for outer membrane proteins
VKRKILVLAGVIAVAASIYVGRLLAQQTSTSARAPEPPQTRIALINLRYVFENYYKYKSFKAEIEETVMKPFQTRDRVKTQEYEKLMRDAQKTDLKPEEREKIELEIRQLKRQVEDSRMEIQRTLHKRSEDAMKLIFKDVQETATKFAQVNNFEVLMAYGESFDPAEYYSVPFIYRRMQPGTFSPLWIKDGMDISKGVLSTLNAGQPNPPASGSSGSSSTATPASGSH